MEVKALRVKVLAPNKTIFEGQASSVKLATETGELELLPGHIPLLGIIDFSVLTVRNEDHVEEYYIRNGSVAIDEDGQTVRVLGQDVQLRADLDVKSIKEYMEFVLEKLSEPEKLSKYQMKFLEDQKAGLEKSFAVTQTK